MLLKSAVENSTLSKRAEGDVTFIETGHSTPLLQLLSMHRGAVRPYFRAQEILAEAGEFAQRPALIVEAVLVERRN